METSIAHEQLLSALADRYLIEREIGQGGMATVYLARDLRHDRRVALKVLLAELGAILGPERFLSEIRVTANLQHPNLLPLFDSGEAAGRLYYVMPYVEGESLRHRMDREKQLPVDEAVRICVACASGLDYAHRRDVIHRDLKPENILLSAGHPVIADFGIALAVSNAGGQRITQSGLSLGTPQYMSPEQAAGDREIDGRSDIYSLGCVLYEMLTGDPPHTGSTVQAVIAKVLVEKPKSVRAERERVPDHVDAAIDRALAKVPADRWATAAEFAEALTNPGLTESARKATIVAGPSGYLVAGSGRSHLRKFGWPTVVFILAAAGAFAWWRLASTPPARPVSFVVPTSPTARLAVDPSTVLFAPDGRSIVYGVSVGGRRKLYVRNLDEVTAREIPGADEARLPFFSPDGRWIAFATESNVLLKLPAAGGTPVELARFSGFWGGGAWSPRGDIVISGDSGLYTLPSSGGRPRLLTRADPDKNERLHSLPIFLPDGRKIVFRIDDGITRTNNRLASASLDASGHELLGILGGNPLGFVGGHLIYGRVGGVIAAVPFDARRGRVTGDPVVLLEDVSVYAGAAASFSRDGSLVYVKSRNANRMLVTDERAALQPGGVSESRRYFFPRFSPDGSRIAVQVPSTGSLADIWVYHVGSQVLSRLTSQAPARWPEWTSDGRHVAYIRERNQKGGVWRVAADGSGGEERYFEAQHSIGALHFSRDGRFVVLRVDHPETNEDLWTASLDNAGRPGNMTPFLATPFNEGSPRVSPDGRRLAYMSDESGRNEVYVGTFPRRGARIQVSTNGGAEPVWNADGSRLIYRSGDKFISAALTRAAELSVASRTELFDDRYLVGTEHPQYDIDPTGRRFVLLQAIGDPEIVVVLDGLEKMLKAGAGDR